MNFVKLVPVAVVALLNGCLSVGCQSFQTDKTFDILHGMAVETQKSLANGATQQFSVSAQGINPTLKTSVGVEYYAKVGYDGLAGQVTASGAGVKAPISEADAATIRSILQDTTLGDRERQERIGKIVQGALAPQK